MGAMQQMLAALGSTATPGLATLNPSDKASIVTLGSGNTTAIRSASPTTYAGVRATRAVATKAYWEVSCTWGAAGVLGGFGLALSGLTLGSTTVYPGSTSDSAAFWGANNTLYINGTPTDYTNAPGGVNTYCIAFDPATGKGWVRDLALGTTYFGGGDPVAGTSPTFTLPAGTSYYPIISLVSGYNDTVTANFGQAAYSGTPPTGYGNV